MPNHLILQPQFERAYWLSEDRLPYRRHPGFSSKKRHFEPEEHSAQAERFARELAREASLAEIHRIYENCVSLLAEKRSRMEKSESLLECSLFRYEVRVFQDPSDPALVLYSRRLDLKCALNQLPEAFDEVFPWKLSHVVVPFEGEPTRRELLEALESWESRLQAKIEESADGLSLRLRFGSGLLMAVEQGPRELVFSRRGEEGVRRLASVLSSDLSVLGLTRGLL